MILKKNTLFVVIGLLVISSLNAQTPEELIVYGNKLYQEGKYEDAIDSYQQIISQGFESSSLYYNLGNAHFRTGKLGSAILFYEKGLKLAPGDEDISYNLRIANARTIDQITQLPKIFIIEWWEILITSLSLSLWAVITLVIYLVFLTSIGLYFLSRRISIQKISFLVSSIFLALLIISSVILFSRYNYEATTNYGILLETSYSVKTSPDVKGTDAFVIHEGIKFVIEDKVNDWYKIRLVDGKVGWIPKNSIGQI